MSRFAHNYICLTVKFDCFKSTFLQVKSKMFRFGRDNPFGDDNILCGVCCALFQSAVFFPSHLRGSRCFYLLENCSGSVIILGFDLFDVKEVDLMSQTIEGPRARCAD